MTDTLLQRASQLIEHGRFEEAEKYLREVLASDPDQLDAMMLLALCRSELHDHKESLRLIKQVIGKQPDNDYYLYLHALFSFRSEDHKEAIKFINNAIAYNPYNADYFGLLASINLYQKDWKDALDNANKGLEINAENLTCLNVRSSALFKLDKKDEAYSTIREALNHDPENDHTHANIGWGLLEKGEHQQALVHFREALKLNPQNAYAKAGLVEGLKARYWLYRIFLKYAFWIGNLKGKGQWAVILGLFIGIRILREIAERYEAVSPFIMPIVYTYAAFALSTWIIGPLSNLFLRLNIYGRYALTEEEIKSSNLVGVSLAIGIIGGIGLLLSGEFIFLMLLVFGITMMIPLSSMLKPRKKKSKNILIAYTCFLAVTGIAAIILEAAVGNAGVLPLVYFIGVLAYQWVANAMMIR